MIAPDRLARRLHWVRPPACRPVKGRSHGFPILCRHAEQRDCRTVTDTTEEPDQLITTVFTNDLSTAPSRYCPCVRPS
jgi:hypothetical protein